jgi:hypothetical protein
VTRAVVFTPIAAIKAVGIWWIATPQDAGTRVDVFIQAVVISVVAVNAINVVAWWIVIPQDAGTLRDVSIQVDAVSVAAWWIAIRQDVGTRVDAFTPGASGWLLRKLESESALDQLVRLRWLAKRYQLSPHEDRCCGKLKYSSHRPRHNLAA